MPHKYEDLRVFRRARALVRRIYRATANFPKEEIYGITSQMRRAAFGVLSNIAESQGRLTYGESRQLLSHARGSLFEVEAQSISAADLGFLANHELKIIRTRVSAVARPLTGFIRWTQDKELEAKRRHP